jgi:hypothetical protein
MADYLQVSTTTPTREDAVKLLRAAVGARVAASGQPVQQLGHSGQRPVPVQTVRHGSDAPAGPDRGDTGGEVGGPPEHQGGPLDLAAIDERGRKPRRVERLVPGVRVAEPGRRAPLRLERYNATPRTQPYLPRSPFRLATGMRELCRRRQHRAQHDVPKLPRYRTHFH